MTSSRSDPERTGNLLGALVLVLHDRLSESIDEAVGENETGAAALNALADFLDEPTIGRVHEVLGLTPSGAGRLVDRREADGYLVRRGGRDGRSTTVRLTRSGRAAARRVVAARAAVLDRAVAELSAEERRTLDGLLSKLLPEQIRGPGAQRWMCRLCNTAACGRDRGQCPVANAARERYAGNRA
jgi:DNA-binding MarR family transcriptional regulator